MDVVYWKNSGCYVGPCVTQEHAHPGIQIYAANDAFEVSVDGERHRGNFFIIPPGVKRELNVQQDIVQQSVCRVCPKTLKILPLEKVAFKVRTIALDLSIDSLRESTDAVSRTRETLLDIAGISENAYQDIDERVQKTLGFIHQIRCDQVSLSELSDYVHLSESHFKKLFKREVEISLQNYIQWYRLRLVFQLLHEYQDTSTAIFEAGFSDQAHFSRLFKRHFGWTPMQFLKPDGLVNIHQAEKIYQ